MLPALLPTPLFYKNLIDNLPLGVVYLNDNGILEFLSTKARSMLLLDETSGTGDNVLKYISEEYHQIYFKRQESIKSGEHIKNQEYLLKRTDGTKFYCDVNTFTQFDENNGTYRLITTLQDITEKKETEENLFKIEKRCRTIFENAGIPMAICGIDGKPVLVNQAYTNWTGYNSEELKNLTYRDYTYKEDLDRENIFNKDLTEGRIEKYCIEKRYITKQGNLRWCLLTVSLVRDIAGNPDYSIRMAEDITDRVDYLEQLKEKETFYRMLFENANDAIFIINKNSVIDCNQKAVDLFRCSKETFLDKRPSFFSPLLQPDGIPSAEISRLRMALSDKGESQFFEWVHRAVDGHEFDSEVSLSSFNVKDELYELAIVRDITKRKESEEAARESERRLSTLITNLPGIVYRIKNDPYGVVEYISDGCFELTGYTAEDFINQKTNFHLITHPDDREYLRKEVTAALLENRRYKVSYRLLDCRGGFKWVWEQGQGIYNEKNKSVTLEGFITDITDKILQQKALSENERKFRTLVQTIPLGLTVRDINGTITYINDYLLSMFNITKDEFLKSANEESTPLPYVTLIQNLRQSIMRKEIKHGQIEFRAEINDGEQKWIELRMVPVVGAEGEITDFLSILRDITERKKSELALRENEEKYRTLFENIIGAFILTEVIYENGIAVDYKYLEINPGYEKMTGKKASDLLGKRTGELNLPGFKFWIDLFGEVAESGNPRSFERFDADLNKHLQFWIFSPASKRVAAFFIDISDRKIAEASLRESEKRFRSYFELPMIGIAILTPDFRWQEGNERAAQIFGYSREEFREVKWGDLVLPGEHLFGDTFKAMLNNEVDHYTIERKLRRKDGSIVYTELALGCVRNNDETVNFFVALINDISEKVTLALEVEKHRNRLESLVEERTRELEDVNRLLQNEIIKQKKNEEKVRQSLEKEKELSDLKSRFISITSHEFRTPLTAISLAAQLLEKFGRAWDEKLYYSQLSRIKEYINHLTNILDDVLTIGRAESGKLAFEPRAIELKPVCDMMVKDISGLLKQNHEFIYVNELADTKFLIDEKLLKYFILNLLSNAIKYSPAGGKIEFSVKETNSNIAFEISDEGIGILPIDQPFLFEPFHRGKNVGEISGTGLGMSIIKRAVDMHNGTITFSSKEKEGTTFTINIPRVTE